MLSISHFPWQLRLIQSSDQSQLYFVKSSPGLCSTLHIIRNRNKTKVESINQSINQSIKGHFFKSTKQQGLPLPSLVRNLYWNFSFSNCFSTPNIISFTLQKHLKNKHHCFANKQQIWKILWNQIKGHRFLGLWIFPNVITSQCSNIIPYMYFNPPNTYLRTTLHTGIMIGQNLSHTLRMSSNQITQLWHSLLKATNQWTPWVYGTYRSKASLLHI